MKTALLLVATLASALSAPVEVTPVSKCGFDLAFVVDSSALVGGPFFEAEADFVAAFTAKALAVFGSSLGEDGVQVSVTLIKERPETPLSLAEGRSTEVLEQQLQVLKDHFRPGLTNTAAALRRVRSDVFTGLRGDRGAFPNLAVLVSDGRPVEGSEDPVKAADDLRSDGALVLTVGTDDWRGSFDNQTLLNISGGDRDLALSVKDWQRVFASPSFVRPLQEANKLCKPDLSKLD